MGPIRDEQDLVGLLEGNGGWRRLIESAEARADHELRSLSMDQSDQEVLAAARRFLIIKDHNQWLRAQIEAARKREKNA